MRYLVLQPSPALAETVEGFWAYEGYKPPHSYERVFPSGTVEILLNLTDGTLRGRETRTGRVNGQWSGLLVAGVHHQYQLVDTAQQYAMLGVALRPGGAWRLFGISSDELTDRLVPLEAILGRAAVEWAERLIEIKDPLRKLHWLDRQLCARILRPLHAVVAWAAEQFIRYPDTARVGVLADEAGMSERRLNALFQREIGVSPKSFARIRRFQTALSTLRDQPNFTLSRLSNDLGYSDQAHMIREFKSLSGFTPAQYRKLSIESLCHIPDSERDQICPAALPSDAAVAA